MHFTDCYDGLCCDAVATCIKTNRGWSDAKLYFLNHTPCEEYEEGPANALDRICLVSDRCPACAEKHRQDTRTGKCKYAPKNVNDQIPEQNEKKEDVEFFKLAARPGSRAPALEPKAKDPADLHSPPKDTFDF